MNTAISSGNKLADYYSQVGRNLSVYSSFHRLQKGRGLNGSWFSKVFYGTILPMITSSAEKVASHFGKQALTGGIDVATDVLSGKKFSESASERIKERVGDTLEKLKAIQKGKGRKNNKETIQYKSSTLPDHSTIYTEKSLPKRHLKVKKQLLDLLNEQK